MGLNAGDRADPRLEPSLLVETAENRADLEVMRDILIDRLHRRSDDFDATRELRRVNSRLQRTSYGTQVVSASS
ncbi:MAG: hypothetical protein ACLPVY_04060 [Acidimicrobiia bacterium]